MSVRGAFAGVVAAVTFAATSASAGEFVEFAPGTGTRGEPVKIVGYFAQPPGAGPFAAVVLLHGCGGFHSSMISWADRLARFGYAALAVDSFGPRGLEDYCAGGFLDQVTDAYAALRYLRTKPKVNGANVAVMGFSQGGLSVLTALEKGMVEQNNVEKFRAGIALYPVCQGSTGVMTAPVLVLIGEADDWTPSAACQAMAAGRSEPGTTRKPGDRSLIELVTFPGAHHAFDVLDLSLAPGRGVTYKGHRMEYNENATRDAIARVRDFLKRKLESP